MVDSREMSSRDSLLEARDTEMCKGFQKGPQGGDLHCNLRDVTYSLYLSAVTGQGNPAALWNT